MVAQYHILPHLDYTVEGVPNGNRRLILEEGGHPVNLGLKAKDPFFMPGWKFGDPKYIV